MKELSPENWAEWASKEVGCEAVAVFVNDPPARVSRRRAFAGEEPREWVPYNVTPLGETAATGLPIHREVEGTKPLKYHSHLYLPLQSGDGGHLGVAWFAAVEPGFFSKEETQRRARECARCLTLPSLER
jgi:hypothetical protein